MKGPLSGLSLHPLVAIGVRRHRQVDVLTDQHPQYQALRSLFGDEHRRISGIVLDILFDHYLYRHWSRFSDWPVGEFREGVYAVLRDGEAFLPQALAQVAPRWIEADWLRVYESIDGVEAVLGRMERRSRHRLSLREALTTVLEHDAILEQGFLQVFSEVQRVIEGGCSRAY